MTKAALLLILFAATIGRSFAGSEELCGNTRDPSSIVDTRKPGGSMEGIPVLDQDGMGYCYAYAASVMVSAWLRSHAAGLSEQEKAGLIVSPLPAVLITGNPYTLKEGCLKNHPCMVANALREQGGCGIDRVGFHNGSGFDYWDAPTRRPQCGVGCVPWESGGITFNRFEEIKTHLGQAQFIASQLALGSTSARERFLAQSDHNSASDDAKAWIDHRNKLADSFQFRLFEQDGTDDPAHNPGVTVEKLKWIAEYGFLNPESADKFALAALAPSCVDVSRVTKANRARVSIDYTGSFKMNERAFASCRFETNSSDYESCGIHTTPLKPDGYLKALNQNFDQPNPQPMVVDYCWSFLKSAEAQDEWSAEGAFTPCRRAPENKEETADHKSVIIGRRWNEDKNRCEFLLRNSWGNQCESYDGDYYYSCLAELRINGAADVWIPAEKLIRNVHGYSKLE